jgi:hypothetical protein
MQVVEVLVLAECTVHQKSGRGAFLIRIFIHEAYLRVT